MLKSIAIKMSKSIVFHSNRLFFKVLRRFLYFLLGNRIKGRIISNAVLSKCRIKARSNNCVKIGENCILRRMNIQINGINNRIIIDSSCKSKVGLQVIINGSNNVIIISENTSFYGKPATFRINGSNCKIEIGNDSTINSCFFSCWDDGSIIKIGNKLDISHDSSICSMEGKTIAIGSNFFCSYNVEIRNSDSHSILSSQNTRINPPKDIVIGDSVWVAQGSLILKGSYIASGCVIGAKSIITHQFEMENCIIVGSPAKVTKTDIRWLKDRI